MWSNTPNFMPVSPRRVGRGRQAWRAHPLALSPLSALIPHIDQDQHAAAHLVMLGRFVGIRKRRRCRITACADDGKSRMSDE
jgi:hypothetical protein